MDDVLDDGRILGDCPFPGCGMPYSLEEERELPSSDPGGTVIVRFYRCAVGHHWPWNLRERPK